MCLKSFSAYGFASVLERSSSIKSNTYGHSNVHTELNVIPTGRKQQALVINFPYAVLVGLLLYNAVDIMHAVGVLTRNLKCPTYVYCKGVCYVFNYLLHNPSKGIGHCGRKNALHLNKDFATFFVDLMSYELISYWVI